MANFAYIEYLKDIKTGDVDSLGNLVELSQDLKKGDIELVSVYAFKIMKKLFPDAVSGVVLEENELGVFLNSLFQNLKSEINKLPAYYVDSHMYLDYVIEEYCDKNTLQLRYTDSNVNDLANKIFILQEKSKTDKALAGIDTSVKNYK